MPFKMGTKRINTKKQINKPIVMVFENIEYKKKIIKIEYTMTISRFIGLLLRYQSITSANNPNARANVR